MSAREELIQFQSDELTLEGRWRKPARGAGVAVICHPHPQFGGTLDNNVVAAVAEALAEQGLGTLRFNFRGVGLSRGGYDFMRGEVEDVQAALSWVKERPDVDQARLFLVGYSFGGLMALYAAAETQGLSALALVSPMSPDQGFAKDPRLKPLANSSLPTFACTGSRDAFCPPQALETLARLMPMSTRIFPDADHFWWGREEEMAQTLSNFLSAIE